MSKINESLLTDWHNSTKITVTPETLKKRIAAMENILERNDASFWNDLVKIFLGFKINGENITFFVKAFQNEDTEFPLLNIDKLVRSLAGIVLSTKLELAIRSFTDTGEQVETEEEEEGEEEEPEAEEPEEGTDNDNGLEENHINYIIAASITNSNFLGQYKTETKIPVVENAQKYLALSGLYSRVNTLSEHEDSIASVDDNLDADEASLDSDDTIALVGAVKSLITANKILSEETNILWWLFGEYSEITDKYFHESGVEAMTIVASKELCDLSSFIDEIPAAKNVLSKVILISEKSSEAIKLTSVKKCVNAVDAVTKQKIINELDSKISEFTPCLLALKKAGKTDWEKPFGTKLNEEFHPRVIAFQFYREFLFIKSLES